MKLDPRDFPSRMSAGAALRLATEKITGSGTPHATDYARFSPGLLDTPEEIDRVLREVRALG